MNKLICMLCLLLTSWGISKGQQAERTPLIPYPQSVSFQNGTYVLPMEHISLYVEDNNTFTNELAFLQQIVLPAKQWSKGSKGKASISILKNPTLKAEAYTLYIGAKGIQLTAGHAHGLLNGLQTLRQLVMQSDKAANVSLPYLSITDAPAFSWRGIELDVARHFFSKQYIFRVIDLLSFYKMNSLHLHLSDDQGWRLEIKKYPKLTEQGAWRTYNSHDSVCLEKAKDNPDFALEKEHLITRDGKTLYGGYYTQDDMREIIAYATRKHIQIIPEIDMPGHMMVATKAYPELIEGKAGWGKTFSVPLNPGKHEVYEFVEGVLQEVIDLFPSRYIHIGADEVEKTSWEQSDLCKQLMQKEGIKDMHALQSYFVNRVNAFIKSKGKKAIGWDETLDGGVDPSMTIMYWRGWVKDSPEKAVRGNHELIMSPTNPLYFDGIPNKGTLATVYDMKVIPSEIPAAKHSLVLGAQGNVWTEFIPSIARFEFMLLPRMTALSERLWTNKSLWTSYQKRLLTHFSYLDRLGYKYRLPDLEGFTDEQFILNGAVTLDIKNPLPSSVIHYTTDGSAPTVQSRHYTGPLTISTPNTIKFSSFSTKGARSDVYQITIKQGQWHDGSAINKSVLKQGLSADFYDEYFKDTKAIKGRISRKEVLRNVHVEDTVKLPSFGLKLRGYIEVPEDGIYNFFFTCDDGGVLRINEQIVIDNDGQHSAILKSGQIALKKGLHPFAIDFVEGGGGFTLKLHYSLKQEEPHAIPDTWFWHTP